MDTKQDHKKTNVVIVGSWNPKIFTPQWITGGRLTESKEIEILMSVGQPDWPMRYLFDEVDLSVSDSRVTITSSKHGNDQLNAIERVATAICSELGHTPVTAFGVNFHFTVIDPEPDVLAIFINRDREKLVAGDCSVVTSRITRTFKRNEYTMNLSHVIDEQDSVSIELNFHHTTTAAKEVAEKLKGTISAYASYSMEMLELLGYPLPTSDQ